MKALMLCLGSALALAGCAARKAPAPANTVQPIGPSYIDLQRGWRLRVVTPLLKSGGYRLGATAQIQTASGTLTVPVGDDFLGYELAYYAVKARGVQFVSAETTRGGHTTPQPQPVAHLFQLPRGIRHVRLIYLLRVSQADHDMAVAAAKDMDALQALTRRIEANPADGCRSGPDAFCTWIPAGIAVVPQFRKTTDGVVEWVPAR